MEAKELRVGNYVKDIMAESYGLDPICVVSAIFSNREHPVNTCKKDMYPCLGSVSEMILGIPLTEEWLLKFGFGSKYKSVHVKWNIGSFELDQKSDEDEYGNSIPQEQVFYFNYQLEIKYVHQLQNLWFSLKGEELILKE